jgi:hypothetical protein
MHRARVAFIAFLGLRGLLFTLAADVPARQKKALA